MLLRTSLAVLMALMTIGCEAFTPPVQNREVYSAQNGVSMHLLDFNSNRRAAYVYVHTDGTIRSAAEPPPDTVLDQIVKGAVEASVDAKTQTGSGKVEGETTLTAKTIERALSVSLFRDASFRLAEAHANGALTADEFNDSLQQLIGGVLELAQVEIENARAKVARADADKAKARANTIEKMDAILERAKQQGLAPEETKALLQSIDPVK